MTGPYKFLIVDDSKTMRMMIKNVLNKEFGKNAEIKEAENGRIALNELAKDKEIHLVLLDWNMPELDGYSALVEMRKDPELKQLKVIMVTTEATIDRVKKASKVGLNGYIVKPFERDKLVKTVRQVTDRIA